MMPAVIVNQMAANTGAVVRNFFMSEKGEAVREQDISLPRWKGCDNQQPVAFSGATR